MNTVHQLIELITFDFNTGGETLFCCVSKTDYARHGLECPLLLEVVKGISDDQLEAKEDYLVQIALTMNLGLGHQEGRYH